MDTDNSAEAASVVHATINGVAVEGQKNETILHCARRYDIYIPTLCELDDIDHTPGTCRICLVEIQIPGQSRSHLVTSCNTPLLDGLDVQTRSPRARAAQRLQVELIMADHNQDCATCTRHGDCELQDVAQFVGLRKNRFVDLDRINTREIDISSPAMIRDMTKCIRCQRCVAVCRDGQGVDALVMTGTGEDTAVGLRHGLSQKDFELRHLRPMCPCVSDGRDR